MGVSVGEVALGGELWGMGRRYIYLMVKEIRVLYLQRC